MSGSNIYSVIISQRSKFAKLFRSHPAHVELRYTNSRHAFLCADTCTAHGSSLTISIAMKLTKSVEVASAKESTSWCRVDPPTNWLHVFASGNGRQLQQLLGFITSDIATSCGSRSCSHQSEWQVVMPNLRFDIGDVRLKLAPFCCRLLRVFKSFRRDSCAIITATSGNSTQCLVQDREEGIHMDHDPSQLLCCQYLQGS